MQLALAVVQDVGRQLPFTVLPAVQSGWVALVREKESPQGQGQGQGQGGGGGGGGGLSSSESLSKGGSSGSVVDREMPQGPLAAAIAKRLEKKQAAAAAAAALSPEAQDPSPFSPEAQDPRSDSSRAKAASPVVVLPQRPVNRARMIKMSEVLSEAGRKRWEGMDEVERKTLVQVFDAEVASYQSVLAAVHASNKGVAAAARQVAV